MAGIKNEKKLAVLINRLSDEEEIRGYRSIPFWSWNDELKSEKLVQQIEWMKEQGFGGYFMHARGGLTTEYLGEEWFKAVADCIEAGERLGMQSWAYDENGWPSGFVGGKLLEDENNRDVFLEYKTGAFDKSAFAWYKMEGERLVRVNACEDGGEYLNIYKGKSNSTVDILNPVVVDKFLALTHEEYKAKLGEKFKHLKGFFTDEPQYYRWKHPYTEMLPNAYYQKYGEDLLEGLGLLFLPKKGYRQFRYRYWKTMQELMLKSFAERVYGWCERNGLQLTGHYIEEQSLYYQLLCCGGLMPFYAFEHIPGVDCLGRSVPHPVVSKQVASVARQLDKKYVLTETFAGCGWDVTPKTLKTIAESQYVNGINLMCQHLLPYSERGQRKRDFPAHFSAVNPWVKQDFKSFNDYFARLGYLLGESEELVSVAVFCPVRSVYFDYQRYDFEAENKVDNSYLELTKKLSKMNIPYHIVDETIMEKHARVKNGKLLVGNCAYEVVVFPEVLTVDKSTKDLFDEYYRQGGKMLFTGSLPKYLEGEEYAYPYNSNTTWTEIIDTQPYAIDDFETEIQSTLREIDGKKFIYAVNTSENKAWKVRFKGSFQGFIRLNLETLQTEEVSTAVQLEQGESAVLFCIDRQVEVKAEKQMLSLDGAFEVISASANYMLLDTLQYSLDGKNYSEKLRYMGIFNELLNKRHSGSVYLKYSFFVKDKPKTLQFMAEDMRIQDFYVNGTPVSFSGRSDVEEGLLYADISNCVKEGINEAVLRINFYESEQVYYVLFGENIDESLRNCLVYDTTVEACCLKGDFGVYTFDAFEKGQEKNVFLGDNFYIGERASVIENSITDGYPFFSGYMRLRKSFTLSDVNMALRLEGNYSLACDVQINGKSVGKAYFSDCIELSKNGVVGENQLELTLYASNRNLLGPHHVLEQEEPLWVCPDHYELVQSWTNGKSDRERNHYSFVRFGLFKEEKSECL